MNKGYEIDARVPSILIAGGSNFPTRKKEKQNAARDSNYREWQDIQGLLDKIRSTGMGGISADDPQAVQKLEKKLENLEKSQETMKAVNAYYLKHKTLMNPCPHLSPEQLEKFKAGHGEQLAFGGQALCDLGIIQQQRGNPTCERPYQIPFTAKGNRFCGLGI